MGPFFAIAAVHYGLEAPDDGAAGVPAVWAPARQDMSFSHLPAITGGHLRTACRDQFRRYAVSAPPGGLRRYADRMAALPDYAPDA